MLNYKWILLPSLPVGVDLSHLAGRLMGERTISF